MKENIIKVVREIVFRQSKSDGGANIIAGVRFYSPDSDGPAISKAMNKLKSKQIVTITMTITEE